MNHALKAVIALAMGVGMVATAQAHGTNMHRTAAMSQRPAQMSQRQPQTSLSRQRIRTAQQQLKADGLYKGKVDGKFNRETRMALARFQQRNGLHRTATLNRRTFDRLTGNQAVGVGSSQPKMPTRTKSTTPPKPVVNGNGSGSSTNSANTPMVPPAPPATNSSSAGASNNTGMTNQTPAANNPPSNNPAANNPGK